jgi:hypothetical protein
MKIIKSLVIAAGLAGLAACGGAGEENNAANLDANLTTDMNAGMDMNAMDMNATDMNAGLNAGTDVNATGTTDTGTGTDAGNTGGDATGNTAGNTL